MANSEATTVPPECFNTGETIRKQGRIAADADYGELVEAHRGAWAPGYRHQMQQRRYR